MTIEEIKKNTNMQELLEFLNYKLEKKGSKYFITCPFHNERTASCVVNDNYCYCFGCMKSFNSIDLIMQNNQLAFLEACEFIASNIFSSKLDYKNTKEDEELFTILNDFMLEASYNLSICKEVKDYLYRRGLNDETIEYFNLGYVKNIKKDNAKLKLSLFKDRLLIPIRKSNAKLVGFGARALKKTEKVKYVNSINSEIFNKSNILFNLDKASNYVKKEDEIFICEGYFDVILSFSKGVKNIVAPLGTALNDNHLKYLKSRTLNITLAFDNDSAGINATLKAIKLLITNDCFNSAKVVKIPSEYKDLGEYFKKNTSEDFFKLEKNNIFEFLAECFLNNEEQKNKAENYERIKEYLALIKNEFSRYKAIETISYKAGVKSVFLEQNKAFSTQAQKTTDKIIFNKNDWLEASIINIILKNKKELEYVKSYLDCMYFSTYKIILEKIIKQVKLEEQEEELIKINANDEYTLRELLCFKIREFSLKEKNKISEENISNFDKALKIKKINENIKALERELNFI